MNAMSPKSIVSSILFCSLFSLSLIGDALGDSLTGTEMNEMDKLSCYTQIETKLCEITQGECADSIIKGTETKCVRGTHPTLECADSVMIQEYPAGQVDKDLSVQKSENLSIVQEQMIEKDNTPATLCPSLSREDNPLPPAMIAVQTTENLKAQQSKDVVFKKRNVILWPIYCDWKNRYGLRTRIFGPATTYFTEADSEETTFQVVWPNIGWYSRSKLAWEIFPIYPVAGYSVYNDNVSDKEYTKRYRFKLLWPIGCYGLDEVVLKERFYKKTKIRVVPFVGYQNKVTQGGNNKCREKEINWLTGGYEMSESAGEQGSCRKTDLSIIPWMGYRNKVEQEGNSKRRENEIHWLIGGYKMSESACEQGSCKKTDLSVVPLLKKHVLSRRKYAVLPL
ncbi:hypothetical protein HY792_02555 [Candidatus Desantisbacteria bacterium]|nr:hypothetical protein [Candidatus Desantisbacteria bacterium]